MHWRASDAHSIFMTTTEQSKKKPSGKSNKNKTKVTWGQNILVTNM